MCRSHFLAFFHEGFIYQCKTADKRVYHLALRPGEVANRIVTVGSLSRAETIRTYLDSSPTPFVVSSERGFQTVTGRYRGTPVSIVSIGMGSPNMDFFVREVRECLSGDMYVVRLGSCGALIDLPVGSVVVPKGSVAVNRNYDFDFRNPEKCSDPAYRISKVVIADPDLHQAVCKALYATNFLENEIFTGKINASADSFYSSQGRQTSFADNNAHLTDTLRASVPDLATLEMETFHLYHLASCWGTGDAFTESNGQALTTISVSPVVSKRDQSCSSEQPMQLANSMIKAAAVHMVFASRASEQFITPQLVLKLEKWLSVAVLDALSSIDIPEDRVHPEGESVWRI